MHATPIAYIVFNRPQHTQRTFAAIRAQRPKQLFIVADGPRLTHPTDAERCKEVRAIVSQIDWPCEVHRNYAEENLGCKQRVITGLDWVFANVECAIILEDDCLPHPDFYDYCSSLLEKHANDQKIMVITGNNFQNGKKRGHASYYFSRYNHVWGWATWRRAWCKNSPNLEFWPTWKASKNWNKLFTDDIERNYWVNIFDRMFRQEIDTWDYSWTASVWYHGGLTATPNVNLVTNIGFGPDGTHTVAATDQDGLQSHPLGPLIHPSKIGQNLKADRYVFDHVFGGKDQRIASRLLRLPRRIAGGLYRRFKGAFAV